MPASYATQALVLLGLGLLAFWVWLRTREKPSLRSVAILVLGDIGRSPRMMYHAESFANIGFKTYVIGNKGATPISSLLSAPNVRFLYLPDPPKSIPGVPFVLYAPRKIVMQVFHILDALLNRIPHPPEFILVQNPPSIPTLALVWFVGRVRGSKVIIDWHNLGYSILALKLGNGHPFVKIARWFESYFGRAAYAHLFVTKAMRDYLAENWSLEGKKVVLHDRPPAHFHRATPAEVHQLFNKLHRDLNVPSLTSFLPSYTPPKSTPFTELAADASTDVLSIVSANGAFDGTLMPQLRADRPALLVSSTSWTPDEDFGMLLRALAAYERRARAAGGRLPKVFMVVTGKGPDRARYMAEIARLQEGADGEEGWKYVRCISVWLEAADYPIMLGSADIGISLHSSSSALDLPMKVVDMFGCGLPVCALNFACLDELVKDGVNGLVFRDAEQLASEIESLLTGFPNCPTLDTLRRSLLRNTPIEPGRTERIGLRSPDSPSAQADAPDWPGRTRESGTADEWEWSSWSQNWDRIMKPVILSDV